MGVCGSSSNVKTQPSDKPNVAESESESESEIIDDRALMLETLKTIPLLASLTGDDHRKLTKSLEKKEFQSGEKLMTQGEQGDEFFILADGKCTVSVMNETGAEVEIAELGSGDYCGEQSLLQDCKRTASVTAVTNATCFVLDQKTFQSITEGNKVRFVKRDAKRMAISAEDLSNYSAKQRRASEVAKAPELTQWLLNAVADNILFSKLDESQRAIVVSQMYKQTCGNGEVLIKQGDNGDTFFVVESGTFDITVADAGKVASLEAGNCVGELALMYDAPRAATVTCTSDAQLWAVDRTAFRVALKMAHENSTAKNIEFLKQCELLSPLLNSELQLIDEALDPISMKAGETVFEADAVGTRFYLVKKGKVNGTAKDGTKFELSAGGFFGERALLTKEPRAATVVCESDCDFLTLTKTEFDLLLGPLETIMTRNLEEYSKPAAERNPLGHRRSLILNENPICALDEFKAIGILGRGAFGVVKLVVDPNSDESFALKAIRKNQVVELGQQQHILNEKRVMKTLDCPFLVNLRGTYKDDDRVYFLLEVCLGGELFTVLRKMRSFDEQTARFYTGCVVEAFAYMHDKDIIFRDLKPENLVLTETGYLKVTDFGFAKEVPKGTKTFTLCGTPDYLAPEIVTGQGHGKAVDWWTVGILVYEMLASFPPFYDDEPLMTYRKIIQGKFKFPRYLSPESKDLISAFLRQKATKRLGVIRGGAGLIRKHPWFAEFDWKSLQNSTLKPPIRPKVKSAKDISNFDHFQEKAEDLSYKVDPDLGWDAEF